MGRLFSVRDLAAIGTIVMACVLFAFNLRLYFQTDAALQLYLPEGYVRTQLYYSLSLVLCVSSMVYAVYSLKRREVLAEQAKKLNQFVQEVDIRQSAIDEHTATSISDANAIITDVNERFVKTFGYSRSEIVGQNQAILYRHKHLDETFLDIGRTTRAGKVWSGEQKLVAKSGETIHVNTTIIPQFDEAGNLIRNLNVRTDITAQRQAEADHFMTRMLEELQDEVFIYDAETLQLTYANLAARDRCGWDRAEVRNFRIVDTAPNFDEMAFRYHVAPLVNGRSSVVTIEIKHNKGPVEIATRLLAGPDERPIFVSVLRDISWRKKIQDAKMELVAIVSHELRSPLTSIKGSLGLLQSGVMGALTPKAQSVVEIAARNSDRLLLVINDILDIEKIDAGKMDFTMQPLDLIRFTRDAIAMNAGYGTSFSVTYELETDLDTAMIDGNSDRLMQVMTNLMSNATKYSPSGEVVTIRIAPQGMYWRVSVIDKGPGIPDSARDTLFTAFAQVTSSDGIKRGGTGLGLVIVKSILKRHNARVNFKSRMGHGTEFYFDIPAAIDTNIEQPVRQDAAG